MPRMLVTVSAVSSAREIHFAMSYGKILFYPGCAEAYFCATSTWTI